MKVLIVGSGLGALATALRLSTQGYNIDIVEKYHRAGGRLNLLEKDEFSFDVGPSFFSMSYEFDELFASCGIENPLKMRALDPVYAVYFSQRKKPFYIYKNLTKLAEEFKDIEPDFEAKATRYLQQAAALFHDTEHVIVKRNYNNLLQYAFALTQVPLKHSPLLLRTMWQELEKHFSSTEVKVIFSLVAFFLGDTPFNTPAVYSLLNYTELQHDGYYSIEGGMYNIVRMLEDILRQQGVRFHFNTEIVSAISHQQKIDGFLDQNGNIWRADLYVCNSDAAAFRGKILQRSQFSTQKLNQKKWTLAPFTIYLGVKGKTNKLHHHNYFLGENFEEYAAKIFNTDTIPQKPYYYVNVPSKSDPNCAPEGCENIFILCPVPDLRYKSDWRDAEKIADNILQDLSARIDFDLRENRLTQTIYTPADWEKMFNLYQGSGLGLAHGLTQVAALRPKNKDEVFGNLYYVGASTTPGTGLPMVVISSKLVCERIFKDYGTFATV
ncbi:MAG: phytoene desaturase family protein [Chitinophagales bacterium]|nr:phytoene desaturase [Bacteroidota bacterium]